MFFKTTILLLLMMQWKFQDITAEAQEIDSKLTELSNDIKQLAKQFEKNAKTTEDTKLELRIEENFQLSILTGQQRALQNKMDVVRFNQDYLNQALGQLRQNQEEIQQVQGQMKLTHDEMKMGQSHLKLTQNEIKHEQSQMKLTLDDMKQAQIHIKLTQDKENNKTNSIFVAIKKLQCDLSVLSLTTQTFNNKRYYFSHDQPDMSWSEADKFCKTHGMDLVSVETKQEWDALKPEVGKLYSKINFPWSSGSDAAQEGKWTWTSTGTDVTFFAGFNSMSNSASINCLYLYTTGWGDHYCSRKLAFICEQNTLC